MERVMAVTTMTCIFLFALLIPSCASLHIDQEHYSSSKQATNKLVHAFPRKFIRINEEVSVVGGAITESMSNNKHKGDVLGNKSQNKGEEAAVAVLHGSKGTWQEWSTSQEGNDGESYFFTMDYSRVRRRRPIHNKSVPVRLP